MLKFLKFFCFQSSSFLNKKLNFGQKELVFLLEHKNILTETILIC